ncbi:hypothetical protein TNCV_3839671 [Trichonephila clavipes]|nr:hypothetical protein TNCV_3839671 [Trichonephila clavipes]
MWTRNYGALGQTARVCFGVLCANRKKEEVKRDFGDLRIRRSEGRVVNTPLVFKRVLFEEKKRTGKEKDSIFAPTNALPLSENILELLPLLPLTLFKQAMKALEVRSETKSK